MVVKRINTCMKRKRKERQILMSGDRVLLKAGVASVERPFPGSSGKNPHHSLLGASLVSSLLLSLKINLNNLGKSMGVDEQRKLSKPAQLNSSLCVCPATFHLVSRDCLVSSYPKGWP